MDEYLALVRQMNQQTLESLRFSLMLTRKEINTISAALADSVAHGFPVSTMADSPGDLIQFGVRFIEDAVKDGEANDGGTGVPTYWDTDTSRWVRFSDNKPIAEPHADSTSGNSPGKIPQQQIYIDPGDTIATLTWEAPMHMGADIDYYELEYRRQGDNVFTRVSDITDTVHELDELENGVVYQITIHAVNEDMVSGPWSNILLFTPMADPTAPHRPAAPQVTPIDDGLYVQWVAPNDGGMAIRYYNLRYKVANGGGYIEITGINFLDRVISNLLPEQVYQVEIQASNPVGLSLYSQPTFSIPLGLAADRFETLQWDTQAGSGTDYENLLWDTEQGSGTMYEEISWPR